MSDGKARTAAVTIVMAAVIVSAAAVVVCAPFLIDEREGVSANDASMHPSRGLQYPSLTAARGGGRESHTGSTSALFQKAIINAILIYLCVWGWKEGSRRPITMRCSLISVWSREIWEDTFKSVLRG